MSEQDGRYRRGPQDQHPTQALGADDLDQTRVDRNWTEDFSEYRPGDPYERDDDGFGPAQTTRLAGARHGESGAYRQRPIPDGERTRTEARYEETGYVRESGAHYQRDPRFDGEGHGYQDGYGQDGFNQDRYQDGYGRPVSSGGYSQNGHGQGGHRQDQSSYLAQEEPGPGYSLFTVVLCSLACLVTGVVGTILVGGLGSSSTPTPTAIATIDPNAATPQQVAQLNEQIATLTKTIQERDAQIHNIQTELDRVRIELAAKDTAATSASQQAAEAEQRRAELDAKEQQLNKQAEELAALSAQLKAKEEALKALETGSGGSITAPIQDAAQNVIQDAASSATQAVGEQVDSLVNQIRQNLGGQ